MIASKSEMERNNVRHRVSKSDARRAWVPRLSQFADAALAIAFFADSRIDTPGRRALLRRFDTAALAGIADNFGKSIATQSPA
jgi:hypothetical protein